MKKPSYLISFRNILLTEIAPKNSIGKLIIPPRYRICKKKLQLLDAEALLHGKCYEGFLPNEKSVNYLGKQSAPDYNCQFEKISPTIKQNQITYLRKWSGDRLPPFPPREGLL